MCFEQMGFEIMSRKQFELLTDNKNNEINEYYNQEKFEELNVGEHIDYDCNIIKDVIKNDATENVIDIEYEKSDMNLSYLNWYYRRDYNDGMNWYINKYPSLPGIEHLAYFMVKKDLTGKSKLDKFEKMLIKKERKTNDRYYDLLDKERNRYIKKFVKAKNETLKKIQCIRKTTIVEF